MKLDSPELIADEVYYVPAAFEYLHNNFYANQEHPPLGKMFIALSITTLGDNPYGWRISSLVFGTIGIFLVAHAVNVLFKDKNLALVATLFMATNTLWNYQSRLATLDVMVTTVTLLCVILFWKFIQKQTLPRSIIFGICLGIAASIKWIALFFFFVMIVMLLLIHTFREDSKIKLRLFIFVVSAFLVGYFFSYLYFNELNLLDIFYSQLLMFNIHTYSYDEYIISKGSAPWTWFLYGVSTLAGKNIIFWTWPIVVFVFVYHSLKIIKKSLAEIYILTIFILFYIPWFFVDRPVYAIYSVTLIPYICIATAYEIRFVYNKFLEKINL